MHFTTGAHHTAAEAVFGWRVQDICSRHGRDSKKTDQYIIFQRFTGQTGELAPGLPGEFINT